MSPRIAEAHVSYLRDVYTNKTKKAADGIYNKQVYYAPRRSVFEKSIRSSICYENQIKFQMFTVRKRRPNKSRSLLSYKLGGNVVGVIGMIAFTKEGRLLLKNQDNYMNFVNISKLITSD